MHIKVINVTVGGSVEGRFGKPLPGAPSSHSLYFFRALGPDFLELSARFLFG
jgi:hypothetical protein